MSQRHTRYVSPQSSDCYFFLPRVYLPPHRLRLSLAVYSLSEFAPLTRGQSLFADLQMTHWEHVDRYQQDSGAHHIRLDEVYGGCSLLLDSSTFYLLQLSQPNICRVVDITFHKSHYLYALIFIT